MRSNETGTLDEAYQRLHVTGPEFDGWTAYFGREVSEQPWRQALETWWPRLLPGVAAAATHGVIRVGHAVRALAEDGEDADHLAELAHGLAYWAARWQPVPGTPATDQSGGIRERLAQLTGLPGWPDALAGAEIPASAEAATAGEGYVAAGRLTGSVTTSPSCPGATEP